MTDYSTLSRVFLSITSFVRKPDPVWFQGFWDSPAASNRKPHPLPENSRPGETYEMLSQHHLPIAIPHAEHTHCSATSTLPRRDSATSQAHSPPAVPKGSSAPAGPCNPRHCFPPSIPLLRSEKKQS